eukprot:618806-Pleurochrysis_carterae.AAC.1
MGLKVTRDPLAALLLRLASTIGGAALPCLPSAPALMRVRGLQRARALSILRVSHSRRRKKRLPLHDAYTTLNFVSSGCVVASPSESASSRAVARPQDALASLKQQLQQMSDEETVSPPSGLSLDVRVPLAGASCALVRSSTFARRRSHYYVYPYPICFNASQAGRWFRFTRRDVEKVNATYVLPSLTSTSILSDAVSHKSVSSDAGTGSADPRTANDLAMKQQLPQDVAAAATPAIAAAVAPCRRCFARSASSTRFDSCSGAGARSSTA